MAENEIAPLPIGAKLYEYRIDKVLGQGGFGITYLGKNLKTNEDIVIKENIPGSNAYRRRGTHVFLQNEGGAQSGPGSEEWARTNFIREATALANMNHPGVVKVLESFESKVTKTQYYIMPYIGAESLGHGLKSGIAPTYSWLHYVLCSLLHTLSYVHARGVLHRDIKPDNILIRPDGQPVLIDFGSARGVDTSNKTRIVTEDYSPIEQVRGEGEGPWTDIYALGATFYHIVTGKSVPRPVERMSNPDSYVALTSQEKLLKSFGYPLLASIDHALMFEPSARYSTADEWLKAMEGVPGFQCKQPIPLPMAMQDFDNPSISVAPGSILVDKDKRKKKFPWWFIILIFLILLVAFLLHFCKPKPEAPVVAPPPVEEPKVEEEEIVPEQEEAEPERRLIVRPGAKMYDIADTSVVNQDHNPESFAVYYIVEEKDDYYLVTSKYDSMEPEGAMRKSEVYVWPNNITMRYRFGTQHTRRQSLFFDTPENAQAFVRQPKDKRDDISDAIVELFAKYVETPDSVKDILKEVEDKIGVIALEPRRKGGQYLMPVLDYLRESHDDDIPKEVVYGSSENATGIVKVAAMTTQKKSKDVGLKFEPTVEVIFVVDTSKSMSLIIRSVMLSIDALVQEVGKKNIGAKVSYGLVAYRDWRALKSDGTGEDKSFYTAKDGIGYSTRSYYNVNHNCLFNHNEFLAILRKDEGGRPMIRQADGDSIDCHEDMIAGLTAAMNMPHQNNAMRVFFLIGDAPARANEDGAACESNGRETPDLKIIPTHWAHRAKGSLTGKSFSTMKGELEAQQINVVSIYIRPQRYKDISNVSAWKKYVEKATKQFRDLCSKDGVNENFFVFDAIPHKNDLETVMKIETEGYLDNAVENLTKFIFGSLMRIVEVSENPDIMKGQNSAIDMIFQEAYVNWLSQQTPEGVEQPLDMTGWTTDKNEKMAEYYSTDVTPMDKCVVLSRRQFENLFEKLSAFVDGFAGFDDGGDCDFSLLSDLVNSMLGVMKDPEREFSGVIDEHNLTRALHNLPYKTQLVAIMQDFLTDGKIAEDITENASKMQKIWDLMRSKLEALRTYSNDASTEKDVWLKDGSEPDNRQKDFIILPMDLLP